MGDYLPVDFARCEVAIQILGPLCYGKTGNLHLWWGRVKEGKIQQVIPDIPSQKSTEKNAERMCSEIARSETRQQSILVLHYVLLMKRLS